MADVTVYGSRFADLYDLFHSAKDYRAEAAFVRDSVDRIVGSKGQRLRLLDLACGTGSHALAFSRLDCDVTGIDIAPGMLRLARLKSRKARRKIRFERGDLSRLALRPASCDVITCLFDSLGYLRTEKRIAAALRRMHRALRQGGVLAVEVWHAPAMERGFDPLRVRRVSGRGLEAVRIGETRLLGDSLAEVKYEIFVRRGTASWRRFEETHVNRFFTRSEIESLISGAGFRIRQVTGGYSDLAPSQDAWHLVIVADREAEG